MYNIIRQWDLSGLHVNYSITAYKTRKFNETFRLPVNVNQITPRLL